MNEIIRSFGSILLVLLNIYGLALFVKIILSWISLPPSKFTYYLNMITEPAFTTARRILPLRLGAFDLSVLLPFLAIAILNEIISQFMIYQNPLTLTFLIYLVLKIIGMIEGFIFFILLIVFGVLLIFEIFKVYASNPIVYSMNALVDPIIQRLSKLFTIRSKDAKTIYLVILIVVLFIAHILFNNLLGFCYGLLKPAGDAIQSGLD